MPRTKIFLYYTEIFVMLSQLEELYVINTFWLKKIKNVIQNLIFKTFPDNIMTSWNYLETSWNFKDIL